MPEASRGAFRGADLPDLEDLRSCVHCGICLPQCPTYRLFGQEMDSPRGRIYLIRAAAEGRAELTERFGHHLDLCLGCRACESACPSGVPFGRLLEATRAQLRSHGPPPPRPLLLRFIFSLFPFPRRLAVAVACLRLYRRSGLQALVRRTGVLGAFPRIAAMDALLEEVPRPLAIPPLIPARGPRRGRVGLLTGCIQRSLFPHVNLHTARLLSLAGYEVVVPAHQGCCGALDLHAGRLEEFRARARALAASFPEDLDLVVTNAAGCGSAIKEYGHWIGASTAAGQLAVRTRDVSEVLAEADLPLGPLEVTVAYHDACHLAHGQRLRRQPRALLRRIPGLRLVELTDGELCCGSAGVYNLLEPAVADRLLELKIGRIADTGAAIVATGNPGCLLQLAKGARARGIAIETVHPVELLSRSADKALR